jgi:hypothetical protein
MLVWDLALAEFSYYRGGNKGRCCFRIQFGLLCRLLFRVWLSNGLYFNFLNVLCQLQENSSIAARLGRGNRFIRHYWQSSPPFNLEQVWKHPGAVDRRQRVKQSPQSLKRRFQLATPPFACQALLPVVALTIFGGCSGFGKC